MQTEFQTFDDYRDEAETIIISFLKDNYYENGSVIGQDYVLCFLADKMECCELVHAGSNWEFLHGCEERFVILHLNNYDKAFIDFSDAVAETESEIFKDFRIHVTDNFKMKYEEMDFEERMKYWNENHQEVIHEYNQFAREEEIYRIVEEINWEEIEDFFNEVVEA